MEDDLLEKLINISPTWALQLISVGLNVFEQLLNYVTEVFERIELYMAKVGDGQARAA